MAGKGHAKGIIKGPDIKSTVIVDTSNAERQLDGFITKLHKSSKQLEIDVGIDALKNAKKIWDAMASEMKNVGKSDIFNGMANSFNKANEAFKQMTVTFNGKELKGLTEVVKTLTSSDFDKISKIDFGISGIRNGVLEAKKLEEITKQIAKHEEDIAKTRKKSSRKSDVTEKLNKEIASIKRRVSSIANLNLGFRVDVSSMDDISVSVEKLEDWAAKLIKYREELEKLKGSSSDASSDVFQSLETIISSSLDGINSKLVETRKLLDSTNKENVNIQKDISANLQQVKKQIKEKKKAVRTQQQVNAARKEEIDLIKQAGQAAIRNAEEQTKATEKLAEARLKLSQKKEGNYTVPDVYTALDGKYEIAKGKSGWDVYQRDNAGLYNLIGTYKHLNDVRNDASLLTREEIIRTDDVIQEIKALQESYIFTFHHDVLP